MSEKQRLYERDENMSDSHKSIRGLAAVACVLIASSLAQLSAHAQPTAMVTDVAGAVTAQSGAAKGEIAILAEIEAGTRLQVAAAARLTVIYLKSGDEYTISGPALIEFRATEPIALSGAAPTKRANPLEKGGAPVRISPIGVAQGAIVMRSARPAAHIKLLNMTDTWVLERTPEFRWQAVEPGLRYQFELSDETGKALFEVQVEGVALTLPPTVQLQEGVGYSWMVSSRLRDGRRYMNSGDFTIAPAELRARVETLRPASTAPVSERVAFAAWLEQMKLKDEARKYWRVLAGERPQNSRLKELAAE
jgi:hypothetical protein